MAGIAALSGPSQEEADELALSAFTEIMRAKLAASRAKGRNGWQVPELCPVERLAEMMAGHLGKTNEGNFVDLAVFSMMLHMRQAPPAILLNAIAATRRTVERPNGENRGVDCAPRRHDECASAAVNFVEHPIAPFDLGRESDPCR